MSLVAGGGGEGGDGTAYFTQSINDTTLSIEEVSEHSYSTNQDQLHVKSILSPIDPRRAVFTIDAIPDLEATRQYLYPIMSS